MGGREKKREAQNNMCGCWLSSRKAGLRVKGTRQRQTAAVAPTATAEAARVEV